MGVRSEVEGLVRARGRFIECRCTPPAKRFGSTAVGGRGVGARELVVLGRPPSREPASTFGPVLSRLDPPSPPAFRQPDETRVVTQPQGAKVSVVVLGPKVTVNDTDLGSALPPPTANPASRAGRTWTELMLLRGLARCHLLRMPAHAPRRASCRCAFSQRSIRCRPGVTRASEPVPRSPAGGNSGGSRCEGAPLMPEPAGGGDTRRIDAPASAQRSPRQRSVSWDLALHAASALSSRSVAVPRSRPAADPTRRLSSASVPTWLSNGPTPPADSTID